MTQESRPTQEQRQQSQELERQASQSERGILGEFVDLMVHNKKWWLTPIIVVLLLIGMLIVLGGSGVAPFIYTLF